MGVISFYLLIIITVFLFLISINFKISKILVLFIRLKNFLRSRKNISKIEEDIFKKEETNTDNESKRIQDILPFNEDPIFSVT